MDQDKTIREAYELEGDDCEHSNCRVDAVSVMVADGGPRHGKRHLNIRARCEDCRRLFIFGDVLEKTGDGTKINVAMTAGPVDPTPQCNTCRKDMPGVVASNFPVDCAACIAEARAIQPERESCLPPPPSDKVVNYNRGIIRPVGTAKTVHPGAAIFGFMGWLTTRDERSGPFSSTDDAASAAELAGAYTDAQGWKGDDFSMKDLVAGPPFTLVRCDGVFTECVGCRDCETVGA